MMPGPARIVVFGRSDGARHCGAHITVISGRKADKGWLCAIRIEKNS
jgi:hypothetical protein